MVVAVVVAVVVMVPSPVVTTIRSGGTERGRGEQRGHGSQAADDVRRDVRVGEHLRDEAVRLHEDRPVHRGDGGPAIRVGVSHNVLALVVLLCTQPHHTGDRRG